MATFLMFGRYTSQSVRDISAQRTVKITDQIKKLGGDVKSMYALLGKNDLVFIVDFPSTGQAMKTSIALNKSTGISFSTSPAVTVEEFDKLIADV